MKRVPEVPLLRCLHIEGLPSFLLRWRAPLPGGRLPPPCAAGQVAREARPRDPLSSFGAVARRGQKPFRKLENYFRP